MPKLSILIPSVPSRKTQMIELLDSLENQLLSLGRSNDVEILVFYDNKLRTVGAKRNDLLYLAKGEYLAFIDDDDNVSDSYFKMILEVLDTGAEIDCLVFDQICTINDGPEMLCKYGIEYEYNDARPPDTWTGKPAHTMVWKSSLAKEILFKEKNVGEDMDWVHDASVRIVNQSRIDAALYYYKFNLAITETR